MTVRDAIITALLIIGAAAFLGCTGGNCPPFVGSQQRAALQVSRNAESLSSRL